MDKEILFRRVIGFTAAFFIPLCMLFYRFFGVPFTSGSPYLAMSCFYYTNARNIFVGAITILIIFYSLYSGYELIDKIINVITAIFLFGIVAFPVYGGWVDENEFAMTFNMFPYMSGKTSSLLHTITGDGSFILQAVNVTFLFTKSSGEKTRQKKMRNAIYYSTGAIIALFVILLVLNQYAWNYALTYICIIEQLIGFFLLGFCWLVKGETFKFLNDR